LLAAFNARVAAAVEGLEGLADRGLDVDRFAKELPGVLEDGVGNGVFFHVVVGTVLDLLAGEVFPTFGGHKAAEFLEFRAVEASRFGTVVEHDDNVTGRLEAKEVVVKHGAITGGGAVSSDSPAIGTSEVELTEVIAGVCEEEPAMFFSYCLEIGAAHMLQMRCGPTCSEGCKPQFMHMPVGSGS
jgi:hypothetical protein